MYKVLQVEFISKKNANYASNNGMYIKRDKVRIKRIASDLYDDYPFNSHYVTFYLHSIVTSIISICPYL